MSDENYFVDGMPNDDYHCKSKGISSTGIKLIADEPAQYMWDKAAEQDESKLDAIDFGTDFHLYFLEPDVFAETHKVLPAFNRRKKDEKQAELDMIEDWKANGITAVKHEDMIKLEAMRQSALSHPVVAACMALDGVAERSYFWTDKGTGVKCKCRPDWLVLDLNSSNRPAFVPDGCTTLILDMKAIGQFDRIQKQIEDLKYFVQDVFYSRGVNAVTGTSVCFAFAFVSTTLSMGRYPVRVVVLDHEAKMDGNDIINDALELYSQLDPENDSDWQTVQTIDRPAWARKKIETVENYDELMA